MSEVHFIGFIPKGDGTAFWKSSQKRGFLSCNPSGSTVSSLRGCRAGWPLPGSQHTSPTAGSGSEGAQGWGDRGPGGGESPAGPTWLRGDPTAAGSARRGGTEGAGDPNPPGKWWGVRQGRRALLGAWELWDGCWEEAGASSSLGDLQGSGGAPETSRARLALTPGILPPGPQPRETLRGAGGDGSALG